MARRNPASAKEFYDIALDALKEKRVADAKRITLEAHAAFPKVYVPDRLQRFVPFAYDIDKLAEDLGLPKWDDIEERNYDYIWESGQQAEGAEQDEDGEPNAEWQAAADYARDELFRQWYDAVLATGETLFEHVNLNLSAKSSRKKLPPEHRAYELVISPLTKHRLQERMRTRGQVVGDDLPPNVHGGWTLAAIAIHDIINGIGLFYAPTLKAFLESGPYESAREAVLKHLHVIREWPRLYEGRSAQRMYEAHFR